MAQGESVLRQKLADSAAAPPGHLSAEKALAIAFGRAGREMPGLGLRMAGFARDRLPLAGFTRELTPGALGLVLSQARPGTPGPEPAPPVRPARRLFGGGFGETAPEAPAARHFGLAVADPGLVTALIEARMTGHVAPGRPSARDPTRIDALITGSLVDAALVQFDQLMRDSALAGQLCQWRSGEMVAGAASAVLTLGEGDYSCFTLEFDFADGARSGRLTLAFPEQAVATDAPEQGAAGSQLAQVVLQARGDLRAVLARVQVPLARLSAWEAGDTIPLSRSALSRVRIEDIDGELVGRGRLGQLAGARAVRLSDTDAAAQPHFALAAQSGPEPSSGDP